MDWLIGIVMLIFKKKGSAFDVNNYHITLLSCLGKLLTCILNNRLYQFFDEYDVIKGNQAAFHKGYITPDNIFLGKCLVDVNIAKK